MWEEIYFTYYNVHILCDNGQNSSIFSIYKSLFIEDKFTLQTSFTKFFRLLLYLHLLVPSVLSSQSFEFIVIGHLKNAPVPFFFSLVVFALGLPTANLNDNK